MQFIVTDLKPKAGPYLYTHIYRNTTTTGRISSKERLETQY